MSDEMIKDIDTTPDVQMQDVIRDSDDKAQRSKGKTFFRKKVCRFCANKAKIDYKDADGLALEIKRARAICLLRLVTE